VIVLAALLFLTTLLPGSDDEVVQRTHARIVGDDVVAASCSEVFAGTPEPGLTTFNFRFEIRGEPQPGSRRYAGRVTFSLGDVVIRMPRSIGWGGMSRGDRERANALRRAIYHHEVGHIRVAEAVRDALNAQDEITAPDEFAFGAAAHAAGRDGFDRFKREQREYDALTEHGRKQHAAPGALTGPDTLLYCP
jgi:Bacterial protein of unknown function (DUF922)